MAVIESAGLAPSGAFTEQFQGLTLKENDTQLAKLYKLANARQIVENGMQVLTHNPRVAPEQKELARQFLGRVESAIPWTTSDVIKLQTSSDPKATLHNLGVGKTGKGEAQGGAATKQPDDPSLAKGDIVEMGGRRYRLKGDDRSRRDAWEPMQ